MATSKPRITITLSPKVYRALKAFSEGTGKPMSQFVTEVLDGSLPYLEQLASAVQAAKRAEPETLAKIRERMTKLEGVAELMSHQLRQGVDLFAEPPSPPGSNRGGQKPSGGGKVTRLKDHRRAR